MRGVTPNKLVFLSALAALSLSALALAPFVGPAPVSLKSVLANAPGDAGAEIFYKVRVPRVLMAFLAGAGLSVSGMAFQALFGNPLATPFTLGVASGASLGAALWVRFGAALAIFGVSGAGFAAFCGSMLSIALVYGATRLSGGFSTNVMLLAGVAASFFFSSVILLVQYLSDFSHSFRIVRWLMGGLETADYGTVANLFPFVFAGCAVVLFSVRELDLLLLGEETAASRGVDVESARRLVFFGVSLMVGGVVSMCGPIGFVGMMAPHILRLVIGPDHRYLAPASILFGGVFLILCDTVARTLVAPAEMPVGVITALLGGPFFMWLLVTRRSNIGGWE